MDGVSDRLGVPSSPLEEEEGVGDPEPFVSVGTGGGGATFGWFWNTRMARRTPTAEIIIIMRNDVSRLIHPARSLRPGQGRGQVREVPPRVFCHQWSRKSGPEGEPSWGVCTRSTAARMRLASATAAFEPSNARATQGARG